MLEREINRTQSSLESFQEEVDNLKAEWMTPLEAIISQISQNFAKFFRKLDCAGEVELDAGPDPVRE